ncbi:RNA-binding S4 domain-containing protein [Candidatus Poribacteria bacterium]|nr:RNA-binding S4 domain-containing protein [Candidatus Poribacteria bacterium]
MRLDKYLQTSRIIKRRAVATELCRSGRVLVNEQSAKPGRELRVGDRIELSFGSRGRLECEVVELPTRAVRKEDAHRLYRALSDTRISSAEGDE